MRVVAQDAQEKQKSCFVIAPIGNKGTEVRRRSDQVYKHIIAPVVTELGQECTGCRAS